MAFALNDNKQIHNSNMERTVSHIHEMERAMVEKLRVGDKTGYGQGQPSGTDPYIQAWGIKQDLYILKSLIDDVLEAAPVFDPMEVQWVKQQAQKKMIGILTK